MAMRSQIYEWTNTAPNRQDLHYLEGQPTLLLLSQTKHRNLHRWYWLQHHQNLRKPPQHNSLSLKMFPAHHLLRALRHKTVVRFKSVSTQQISFQNPDVTQQDGIPGLASPLPSLSKHSQDL